MAQILARIAMNLVKKTRSITDKKDQDGLKKPYITTTRTDYTHIDNHPGYNGFDEPLITGKIPKYVLPVPQIPIIYSKPMELYKRQEFQMTYRT